MRTLMRKLVGYWALVLGIVLGALLVAIPQTRTDYRESVLVYLEFESVSNNPEDGATVYWVVQAENYRHRHRFSHAPYYDPQTLDKPVVRILGIAPNFRWALVQNGFSTVDFVDVQTGTTLRRYEMPDEYGYLYFP